MHAWLLIYIVLLTCTVLAVAFLPLQPVLFWVPALVLTAALKAAYNRRKYGRVFA